MVQVRKLKSTEESELRERWGHEMRLESGQDQVTWSFEYEQVLTPLVEEHGEETEAEMDAGGRARRLLQ
jgi:hypothetical protein